LLSWIALQQLMKDWIDGFWLLDTEKSAIKVCIKKNQREKSTTIRAMNSPKPSSTVLSSPPLAADSLKLKSLRTDVGGVDNNFDLLSVSSKPTAIEEQRIQRYIEDILISDLQHKSTANEADEQKNGSTDELSPPINTTKTALPRVKKSIQFESDNESDSELDDPAAVPKLELRDIVRMLRQGVEVLVEDDFSRCFESYKSPPWNFTWYLYVLWAIGCAVRYLILFPLRALGLLLGFIIFTLKLLLIKLIFSSNPERQHHYERENIKFLCSCFVFSWFGVIKYHGTLPAKKVNRIYVANHTSMIDMIVLSQANSFSLVGQKHPGWVGFMQDKVLGCLGNAWFNRGQASDRHAVAAKIKSHISDTNSNRLLVFPEGTCVNNEYCVQFKQGVFDMHAEIVPIAIKYNKIFVDAFWNSRKQSFASHLMTLMCSWTVVCDVWYMQPQAQLPGESAIQFSDRVKGLIAKRAGLKPVEWDGYLKHFAPSARYIQQKQKAFAESLLNQLDSKQRRKIEKQLAQQNERLHEETKKSQKKMAAMIESRSNINLANLENSLTREASASNLKDSENSHNSSSSHNSNKSGKHE
jgi:glycerol-3-phosphate O-acyltransferase 3/4